MIGESTLAIACLVGSQPQSLVSSRGFQSACAEYRVLFCTYDTTVLCTVLLFASNHDVDI